MGRLDAPLPDLRERSRVTSALRSLQAIPTGGSPSAVFDALRTCAPVVGGMIGVMGPARSGSTVAHVVGLPTGVLEGWATTPIPHLHRMMAPLEAASTGDVISDRMAITGAFREELDLLRVMSSAGLGESAGYKVAARTTPWGEPKHRFLTLALEGGAVFTRESRALFRQLTPAVEAALSRMALPLLAHEPIFSQVMEERRMGYLCLSRTGSIMELNERAHELCFGYLPSARIDAGRGCLHRFAEAALRETSGGRTWRLSHPRSRAVAQITSHRLAKECHALGDDITLLVIYEAEPPPAVIAAPSESLSARQIQVAELLATTDLTYKEIATRLGISEGTVRKHVEKVYRSLGVRSRASLLFKPR